MAVIVVCGGCCETEHCLSMILRVTAVCLAVVSVSNTATFCTWRMQAMTSGGKRANLSAVAQTKGSALSPARRGISNWHWLIDWPNWHAPAAGYAVHLSVSVIINIIATAWQFQNRNQKNDVLFLLPQKAYRLEPQFPLRTLKKKKKQCVTSVMTVKSLKDLACY